MFTPELTERLRTAGLVAVLTIDDPNEAVPAARALLAGGITAIELTYRTPAAGEAIRRIRSGVPEITIGAGTLLDAKQVGDAFAAGAAFGVAPGCNPRTIRAARECGLPFAPGIATATDIEIAVANHCRVLKYFPAETTGGLVHLQNIAAPFSHLGLQYIPLGGIDSRNLAPYLRSPLVLCVGGSWLARAENVQARNWTTISQLSAEAIELIRATLNDNAGSTE